MQFDSEETRTRYHELPTQTQLDWLNMEELLATMGFGPLLVVSAATEGHPHLEVRIRIYEEPKSVVVGTEDPRA